MEQQSWGWGFHSFFFGFGLIIILKLYRVYNLLQFSRSSSSDCAGRRLRRDSNWLVFLGAANVNVFVNLLATFVTQKGKPTVIWQQQKPSAASGGARYDACWRHRQLLDFLYWSLETYVKIRNRREEHCHFVHWQSYIVSAKFQLCLSSFTAHSLLILSSFSAHSQNSISSVSTQSQPSLSSVKLSPNSVSIQCLLSLSLVLA